MADFLLIAIGSHGDVHPFVGLGQTLLRRGHHVSLATNEHFQKMVERAGLTFISLGDEARFMEGLRDKRFWSRLGGFRAIARWIEPLHRKVYEIILEHKLAAARPVVVASSLSFGARIAQDKFGLPTATVHLQPALFRSHVSPPKLPGMFMPVSTPEWLKTKIWDTGDKWLIDPSLGPSINALRKELDLEPVTRILKDWWHSPTLVLAMFPDWYAPAQTDWPAQTRHVGFPMYDERDQHGGAGQPCGLDELPPALQAFIKKFGKPVAFTPGSAMIHGERFFKVAVECCKRLGKPGLLLTRHGEQVPKGLPENVMHVPYAPFSTLLPQCSALVHHGGIGTTSQALAAGVPQLVMPMAHDQPDNAIRLKRLGVGDSVEPMFFRPYFVVPKLKRLLEDPHVARACAAIVKRFEKHDGLTAAAAELEKVLVGANQSHA